MRAPMMTPKKSNLNESENSQVVNPAYSFTEPEEICDQEGSQAGLQARQAQRVRLEAGM